MLPLRSAISRGRLQTGGDADQRAYRPIAFKETSLVHGRSGGEPAHVPTSNNYVTSSLLPRRSPKRDVIHLSGMRQDSASGGNEISTEFSRGIVNRPRHPRRIEPPCESTSIGEMLSNDRRAFTDAFQ